MANLIKTDEKQTATGKFALGNKDGKKFTKGVSGNPNGRPKITKLTDALRQQLAENAPYAPEETIAEMIARALIYEALGGNVQAAREIADRTEGKPRQSIDLDLQVNDWRALAQNYGVNETDVINEAKLLIAESAIDSGGE
jgi:Holliday junction resolvasome RuvABC ATP-dependent DNA helicase subunit